MDIKHINVEIIRSDAQTFKYLHGTQHHTSCTSNLMNSCTDRQCKICTKYTFWYH